MSTYRPLTLQEVIEQVWHVGGDPATTTFRTWAGEVSGDDNLIDRVEGAIVLDFSGDYEDYDDGADELRMELVGTTHELERATKVLEAVRYWARTGKSGGFDHLHASLKLLAALDAHDDG